MAYKRLSIISLSVLSLALAGCSSGGGGGGGGSTPGGTTYLTWEERFAAAENGEQVSVEGMSLDFRFTFSDADGVQFSDELTRGEGELQLDESGVKVTSASGLVLEFSPDDSADLDLPLGGSDFLAVSGVGTPTDDGVLFIPVPEEAGFEYQNFGVWARFDEAAGRGETGALSVGSKTAVADIPTTGSARFIGNASGFYIDGNEFLLTAAKMTADVSFANRTVAFSTSNTQAGDLGNINGGDPAWRQMHGLNLSGTLSYAAGSNNITGDVRSADGMTGAAAASFYGPNAAEVGGTFAVGEGTTRRFFGGFGGKR